MSATVAENFYHENVVDDIEAIEKISEIAKKAVYAEFKILLGKDKDELNGPLVMPMGFYISVFHCILDYLKSLQKTKESHKINIADRLEVGMTTSFKTKENEDLEKFGNFVFYMKHIDNYASFNIDRDSRERSIERCIRWNESNITSNIEDIKEISKRAISKIEKNLQTKLSSAEVIMPVFCTIHEKIVEYMMLERASMDVFEYHINVGGCYEIYARLLEDGVEISFKPQVFEKGTIKDDGDGSSKYE